MDVKVHLKRKNNAMHFEAINATGNTMQMDGSPDIGGENKGVRPMEMLLMGVAGCSGIDVVMILNKMRQTIDDMEIDVVAKRVKADTYSYYESIHINFILYGDIDPKKAQRAVDLSLEKYCSVSKILEKSAKITGGVEIRT